MSVFLNNSLQSGGRTTNQFVLAGTQYDKNQNFSNYLGYDAKLDGANLSGNKGGALIGGGKKALTWDAQGNVVFSGNVNIGGNDLKTTLTNIQTQLAKPSPKGDKGDQGLPGAKGDSGPMGLIGAKGLIGLPGAKGDSGPMGLIGAKGDQGLIGLPGAKGDSGPMGIKGDKGDTGTFSGSFSGTSQVASVGDGVFMGKDINNYQQIQMNAPAGSYIDFSSDSKDFNGRIIYDNTAQNMGFYAGGPGGKGMILKDGNLNIQGSIDALNFTIGGKPFVGGSGTIGQKGDKGDPGLTGQAGKDGMQGPIGLTGQIGPIGPQGVTGIAGAPGKDGQPGAVGPQGPQGLPGISSTYMGVNNPRTTTDSNDSLYLENDPSKTNYTQMHLYYNDPAGANNAFISLNKGGKWDGVGGTDAGLNIWESGNLPIKFGIGGKERMRISGDGNLNVGGNINVDGNINDTGNIKASNIDAQSYTMNGKPFSSFNGSFTGTSQVASVGDGVFMGKDINNYQQIQMNAPAGSYIDFSSDSKDFNGRIIYDNTAQNMGFYAGGKGMILNNGNLNVQGNVDAPSYTIGGKPFAQGPQGPPGPPGLPGGIGPLGAITWQERKAAADGTSGTVLFDTLVNSTGSTTDITYSAGIFTNNSGITKLVTIEYSVILSQNNGGNSFVTYILSNNIRYGLSATSNQTSFGLNNGMATISIPNGGTFSIFASAQPSNTYIASVFGYNTSMHFWVH